MSDASPAAGKSAPEPGPTPLKRLGKYEIQRMLGKGGMGAVYLAQDTLLKRMVALKVLPKDKAKNPTLVKRFHAEARSAAALRHDNIVMLYENGQADGYDYISLEYVDGTDAARLINTRGILPVRRSTEIIKQVAIALDHAQQQGVVHRDIKPANLLIRRDGVVKLADMGLARIVDETLDTGITRAGTTVGTVDYMSPEQARDSKAADIRSDLYSLGCTWYFLLTGEPPFPEGALTNKLRAHAEKPCPDPRLKNNKVPETVVAVLNRMMAKQPKDRYQHPRDLIADLDRGSEVKQNVTRAILDNDSSSEIVVGPVAAFAGSGGRYLDESDHEAEVPDEPKVAPKSKRTPSRDEVDEGDEPPQVRRKKSRAEPDPEEDAEPAEAPPKRKSRPAPVVDEEPQDDPADSRKAKKRGAPVPPSDEFESDVTPERGNRVAAVADVDLYADEDEPSPRKKSRTEPEVEEVSGTAKRKKTKSSEPDALEELEAPRKRKKKRSKATEEEAPSKSAGGLAAKLSLDPDKLRAVGFYVVTAALGAAFVWGAIYLVVRMNRGAEGNNVVVGPFGEAGAGQAAIAVGEEQAAEKKKADEPLTAKTKNLPDLSRNPTSDRSTKPEPGEWEKDELPRWPGEPLPQGGLTIVNVDHRPLAESSHTPLNPHIDRLGKSGGILRLRGSGPFSLRPVSLAGRGPLMLIGENPDAPPTIVALPATGEAPSGPVTLVKSDHWVAFRDIDVVADPALFANATSLTWLEVAGADLDLRNCTLSMCGTTSARIPTTAVRVVPPSVEDSKREPAGTRVCMDRCLARGDRFTLAEFETPKLEAVLRRVFVWSGDGPALRMSGRASDDSPETQRFVRVRRSTLAGNAGAPVEFAGDPARPVATLMDVRTTWLASAAGGADAALVALAGWNVAHARGALGRTLKWSQAGSQCQGFAALIQLRGEETAAVASNVAEWKERWRGEDTPDALAFSAAPWPASPPGSAHELRLDAFETGGGAEARSPGYTLSERVFPASGTAEQVARESRKPTIPDWISQMASPPQTIEIDLAKDDLAKTLMRPDLPPGTLIVARGAGTQAWPVGPVVIRKNWLRVRFETPDGRLLTLAPKGVDEAWFTVLDGGLELSQVALVVPQGDRNTVPKTYIQATGSDLVLRSCRVQSPLASSTRNQVLVQSVAGSAGVPPARPGVDVADRSQPARAMLIADSYLSGFRTIVEADVPDSGMFVRNSVLVSRGDVCELSIRGAAGKRPGVWDCRSSTLSGSESLYRVTGEAGVTEADKPHVFRHERTLFAPPLVRQSPGKQTPVVFVANGPVLTERQLAWFEDRCGYSAEWNSAMLRDNGAKESLGWPEWENAWGSERLTLALRGATEVILDGDLAAADRARLEPSAFEVAKSCRAHQWADGKPIGADVAGLKVGLGKTGLFPGYRQTQTKGGRPVGL